ncbi:MAG: sel1 repeat family protein, partial [Lentisphaeria bacterium]|nr:sel1 repeat family protein [Lentisphaeria bacterium]
MKMMRWILLWSFFACALWGRETDRTLWQEDDRVTHLFNTPNGRVYRLTVSEEFKDSTRHGEYRVQRQTVSKRRNRKGEERNFYPLSVRLLDRGANSNARFVVADFRIRQFPALQKAGADRFRFSVFLSKNLNPGPETADSVYQVFRIDNEGISECNQLFRWQYDRWICGFGTYFSPAFEWNSIRIMVDRAMNYSRLYCNGYLLEYIELNDRLELPVPRSCGIFLEPPGKGPRIFEVSEPKVYFLQTEAELERLPVNVFTPYPQTEVLRNSAARAQILKDLEADRKNPDAWYTAALWYLDPGAQCDPARALKLLKKAVKEEHVPAAFLLGLAAWRGYGMAPDPAAAEEYLKTAAESGYAPAAAFRGQMILDALPERMFPTREQMNRIKEFFAVKPYPANLSWARESLRELCEDAGVTVQSLRKRPDYSLKEYYRLRPFHLYRQLPEAELDVLFAPERFAGENPDKMDDALYYRYILHQGIRERHPMALLRAAELCRELARNCSARQSALRQQAMQYLDAGRAAGDVPCILLRSRQCWEDGTLTAEDRSSLRALIFRREPWKLLLDLEAQGIGREGFDALRQGNVRRAADLWKRAGDASCHFAAGLLLLAENWYAEPHFAVTPAGTAGSRKMLDEALDLIAAAAQSGVEAAQIWMADFSLSLPGNTAFRPKALYQEKQAVSVLQTAAAGGNEAALYRYAEYLFQRRGDPGVKRIRDMLSGLVRQKDR